MTWQISPAAFAPIPVSRESRHRQHRIFPRNLFLALGEFYFSFKSTSGPIVFFPVTESRTDQQVPVMHRSAGSRGNNAPGANEGCRLPAKTAYVIPSCMFFQFVTAAGADVLMLMMISVFAPSACVVGAVTVWYILRALKFCTQRRALAPHPPTAQAYAC